MSHDFKSYIELSFIFKNFNIENKQFCLKEKYFSIIIS